LYNDSDLYRHFDILRTAVGYVPQQDIVHRKISVQRALAHTARLRLPEDTSETEIAHLVARVLDRVGLADQAEQAIETPAPLSGGQLKRVSLAVELISNPAILFLDEATSGLDAATDKRMMRLFAELSADGKTVVCVTHTLENIEACDLVVLMHRGRVTYVGPPKEALGYFGVGRLTEVYEVIESAPIEEWANRFLASEAYDAYVGRRLQTRKGQSAPGPTQAQVGASRSKRSALRQTKTLTRRYLDLILSDRRNLAILLLQAPLIGLVIGSVFDTGGPAPRQAGETHVSFMLVISAIWFGCLNSAREVVKELPIFLRERAVNLEIVPYLLSKLGPLTLICVIQVVGLVAGTAALVDLSGSNVARTGVLCLAALAATAMGLTVSALVNSSDKAVAAVPVLLIPQVILSNAIVQLEGGSKLVAKASMVSFWAFDAMKNLMDSEVAVGPGPLGTPPVVVEASLGGDLGAMGLLLVAFLASALVALRLKDRKQ
jgi:ABC-type multidrug transport system ATPase subunit